MAALPKLRSSTHGESTDETTSTETATEGEVVGAELYISEAKRETNEFNMFIWQTRDFQCLSGFLTT